MEPWFSKTTKIFNNIKAPGSYVFTDWQNADLDMIMSKSLDL